MVLCDLVNFTRGGGVKSRIIGAVMPRNPSAVEHIDLLRLDQRKQCLKQYHSVTSWKMSLASRPAYREENISGPGHLVV